VIGDKATLSQTAFPSVWGCSTTVTFHGGARRHGRQHPPTQEHHGLPASIISTSGVAIQPSRTAAGLHKLVVHMGGFAPFLVQHAKTRCGPLPRLADRNCFDRSQIFKYIFCGRGQELPFFVAAERSGTTAKTRISTRRPTLAIVGGRNPQTETLRLVFRRGAPEARSEKIHARDW